MAHKSILPMGLLVVSAAVVGFFAAQFFGGDQATSTTDEPEVLYWVAPMDPNFRSDTPGLSPMGMDLVPIYADEEAGGSAVEPSLRISPAVTNNIGVRTAPVERQTMHALVRTVGNIQPDGDKTQHVHVRAEGWIENLAVRTAGDEVAAGDLLFQYYAPDLVNAQAEFVQALRTDRTELVAASRARLRALGMSEQQISEVEHSRAVQQLIDIRAPQDGVVIELNVDDGMYVQPGMTLMALADLSSVWVLVDVFEDDAPRMVTGLSAVMELPFVPGRQWEGEVDYVYPTIDPVSRTLRVRLVFRDTDGALMPNMYGDIEIHGVDRENVLTIPTEALIRSSEGDRVILALGEGRFRPARVLTGIESDGFVEVIGGLHEGETVVTSGQFLIDSEASLDASLLRLAAEEGTDEAAMDMPDESPVEEESPTSITGRGVIVNVMVGHGMVRMRHDPIPALGWPTMTMNFNYAGEDPLLPMAEGTEVNFTLGYAESAEAGGPSPLVLTSITAIPDHSDHSGHGDDQ